MSDDLKSIKNHETNSKRFDVGLVFLWIFLILVIVSPLAGLLLVKVFGFDLSDVGTYGDFLGGSTVPFLTVITILFIYRTYNLQQEQLKTQQKELSLLQKEMESTKETLQEQGKTTKMQRFENSFFIQINELRKSKVEAVAYLKTAFGDTWTFDEWIEYIRNNIDKEMSVHIKDSIESLTSEYEKEEYFANYGEQLFSAYMNSGIYDNKVISSFFNSVYRCMQFIYEYKSSMENWEVDFYLKYLSDEIGTESINIILYDICFYKEIIEIASTLRFDKFANRFYLDGPNVIRQNFQFIEYVFHENPDMKFQ